MGSASITLTPTNTLMTEQLAFLKKVTTKSKRLVQLLAKRVLGRKQHRF